MSHQPERKEKNCLNCGTMVSGRFCHACGQENLVPRQPVGGFIRHFLYDVFHFDGKFFETLKYLLIKPGFVAGEYMMGRRQRYLDPIKMYLFTSAFFFVLFFALTTMNKSMVNDSSKVLTWQERYVRASVVNAQFTKTGDTALRNQLDYLLDTNYRFYLLDTAKLLPSDTSFLTNYEGRPYYMVPRKITSGGFEIRSNSPWLEHKLRNKWAGFKKKYGDDNKSMITDIVNTFLHKLPYVLFVSLPFFALILKLLYSRRKFYYNDHSVFTLYHYIITFILLLIFFLLDALNDIVHWKAIGILSILVFLAPGVFLFLAMKRFYGQGFGKTVLKYIVLNLLALCVFSLLLVLFIILSVTQL